jgi:hypothetical protein
MTAARINIAFYMLTRTLPSSALKHGVAMQGLDAAMPTLEVLPDDVVSLVVAIGVDGNDGLLSAPCGEFRSYEGTEPVR